MADFGDDSLFADFDAPRVSHNQFISGKGGGKPLAKKTKINENGIDIRETDYSQQKHSCDQGALVEVQNGGSQDAEKSNTEAKLRTNGDAFRQLQERLTKLEQENILFYLA